MEEPRLVAVTRAVEPLSPDSELLDSLNVPVYGVFADLGDLDGGLGGGCSSESTAGVTMPEERRRSLGAKAPL